jgi:hypothetical protein
MSDDIGRDPIDPLTEHNRARAASIVDGLDPDIFRDAGAFYHLEIGVHLGVDADGNRLSDADRNVLKHTLEDLKKNLADKYTDGDILDVSTFFKKEGVSGLVRDEVVRRTGGNKER